MNLSNEEICHKEALTLITALNVYMAELEREAQNCSEPLRLSKISQQYETAAMLQKKALSVHALNAS